jgi:hypothetical protein
MITFGTGWGIENCPDIADIIDNPGTVAGDRRN